MNPIIDLQNVAFRWPGSRAPTLSIASWQVLDGESVFIHGPSGCGKSTLLNLLSGILRPSAGTVQVLGQPLHEMSGRSRDRFRGQHIGLVFQQFNLLPYLSVEDNIALAVNFGKPSTSFPGIDAAETLGRRITHLLTRLELSPEIAGRKAQHLSVGQQQRVAVARALINRPPLLIADEPSSALDTDARNAFLVLLLECAAEAGSTVIFVSHDRSIATRFDRVIGMDILNRAWMEKAQKDVEASAEIC